MPPWRHDPRAWIRDDTEAIRTNGGGTVGHPASSVMIERENQGSLAGRQAIQIRKADTGGDVKIGRAGCLNGNDQRGGQIGRQGCGDIFGRDGNHGRL